MSDPDTPSADDSADGCVDRKVGDADRSSPTHHASERASNLLLTDSKINDSSATHSTKINAGELIDDRSNDDVANDDVAEASVSIDQLVSDHSKPLFGYGYRLTGSVADAEDLTQQTLMIAHQKLDQLRCSKSAKSWLCAILRSCWLKSIRRNKPTPASHFEMDLDEILEQKVDESTVDEILIQQAISELPDDYRLVLLMFYFEELSYQQIAEKLGVKMGTVMSRLSRAKDRVKRRLDGKTDLF